ncbi:DUF4249 domain-containing protein [Paludibacter jiangxiensis]|uniref:DUF4249 domain-containing protein n=1 Tax=Paludibacter jiangxiensis TaxID=681398 RepID=A0A161M5S1_9BACT|nr:DUF4249 domain-containing protein [Paludibacter jiangxiensis]GAT63813.1 hypothetical protein PJIAN_4355 [Paludibacter jiangxiensis]
MKPQLYLYAIFMAIAFVSCTTDFNVNLDSIPVELVVDGAISTDTTEHVVRLKKTGNYFCDQPVSVVSGASVTLSDGITSITLHEDAQEKGAYKTPSNYFGVAGRTYTLTISDIDVNEDDIKETYTATSTLNAVPPLKKIQVEKQVLLYENVWAVNAWMKDPSGVSNYYLTKAYKNKTCISDTITEWGLISDALFDGMEVSGKTMLYIRSENKAEKIHSGDRVMLETCSISQDYYNFIGEVKNESRGHNPLLGGQPANIRTNIIQTFPKNAINNPRGYFAAYAISRAETIFK